MKRNLKQDAFILQCCLETGGDPYIGVDSTCNKNSIFCIHHNCHVNDEGLMHLMMPLKQFKNKIEQSKICMQIKISSLVQTFSKFVDNLVEKIQQLKLKKCAELSMLWLRDLARSQDQFQLLSKVYRMDFQEVTCKDIHSIYYRIIHNDELFKKSIDQIQCYQGISQALQILENNKKASNILAEKMIQIQGVMTNGQILKKALPDKKLEHESLKQVLLQQGQGSQNFKILYNKSRLLRSSTNFSYFMSKYSLIPHINYQIGITTKYGNIMLGICSSKVKQTAFQSLLKDIHYHEQCIVFNFANGNTYKDGMFINGSNAAIRGLTQFNVKLRLTDTEVLIVTKKNILMRCSRSKLGQNIYLLGLARTGDDGFEVNCDNDVSANNIQIEQITKQKSQKQIPTPPKLIQTKTSAKHDNMEQKQKEEKFSNAQIVGSSIPNDSLVQVIQEQESNLEQTAGFDKSIKQSLRAFHHHHPADNKHRNSQQISRIKLQLQNLKKNIIKPAKQSEIKEKVQKNNSQWQQQKDMYLRNIKERINYMSPKDSLCSVPREQQKKSHSRKSSKQGVTNMRIPTQSSAFQKINTNSEAENSYIKVNVSESDIVSLPKGSILMSILRKGSDCAEKDEKGIALMAESMDPRISNQKQIRQIRSPIDKIKTPPRMKQLEQRFQINDSFQY